MFTLIIGKLVKDEAIEADSDFANFLLLCGLIVDAGIAWAVLTMIGHAFKLF